ncbi:urea amidolyase associated protein UAAP1 [Paenibacillus cremeus]|uniref:Urea carboxylase-associated family protein n=1 Tax=Paenibacillus cremeus TaxID=2163881 RepID=A0A559KC49_9BACL|nr:urea amidolyase associated protein UAAP1 [Paenibacillus cremeus]TVY09710.1 urea carboxylase-associated family protein [Paenibacillus cremeus]
MDIIWGTTLQPGGKWSGTIGRGKLLRFTALGEGANLALMMYNASDLTERYNMPDTLKAQHTSHLTKGHVLMSDNGRVLASFVEDSLGWHDPICGITSREATDAKYGTTTYQELRNDWLRSGHENMAVELVRNGLGLRDMAPVVNLFSKVFCDEEGQMHYSKTHCQAGATVTLRTEMDVLLVLSNTPNPLDPRTAYPSVPVQLELLPAAPVDALDYCVNYRPENRRAFENTWEYYTLKLTNYSVQSCVNCNKEGSI